MSSPVPIRHLKAVRASQFRGGRQNSSAAFAESDPAVSGRFAPAPQDDLIAILQEFPDFAGGELHGIAAAPCQLQQAAAIFLFGSRDGSAADEIDRKST